MNTLRQIACGALLLSLSACESSFHAKGTVTVSREIVQMFNEENRGRVVGEIHMETIFGFASSLGFICGGSEPIEIPFRFSNLGCASQGTIRFWIEPATPLE